MEREQVSRYLGGKRMHHFSDTIAAQATASGEGGIAIVRLSGAQSEEILDRKSVV